MKVLLYGKDIDSNWDLCTDGEFVISIANDNDSSDSYFGTFHYFVRTVKYCGYYDKLTPLGKDIYHIAEKCDWHEDTTKVNVIKFMKGDSNE